MVIGLPIAFNASGFGARAHWWLGIRGCSHRHQQPHRQRTRPSSHRSTAPVLLRAVVLRPGGPSLSTAALLATR